VERGWCVVGSEWWLRLRHVCYVLAGWVLAGMGAWKGKYLVAAALHASLEALADFPRLWSEERAKRCVIVREGFMFGTKSGQFSQAQAVWPRHDVSNFTNAPQPLVRALF
jgi:hypothetical protein